MTSLARVMGADIAIPDFSCISRRTIELPVILMDKAIKPGSLVIVDSTGLKVYGKDEWHQEKHAVPARRTWRKLHLATDEHHQILACELTAPKVGDRQLLVTCWAKSPRRSRPSLVMEPTLENLFHRQCSRINPKPRSSFLHTKRLYLH